MAGPLAGNLGDVLAKVGLHDVDSETDEMRSQVDLLSGHRLGLRHEGDAMLDGDPADRLPRLPRCRHTVDDDPVPLQLCDESGQVPLEVAECFAPDVGTPIAQLG